MKFANFTILLLIIISGSINAQVNYFGENVTLMNQKGEIISAEDGFTKNKDGEAVIVEVLNPSQELVDEYLKKPIKEANNYEAGPLPEAEYLSDLIYSTDGSKVFILGRQSESVTVFDVSTMEVDTNIQVQSGPLSIDLNDNVAVVACHFDWSVAIIDLSDYSTVHVATSDRPTYVKINPAGTHAYVGVLNGTCEIINLSTHTLEATITDFPIHVDHLSTTSSHGRNVIVYNPFVFTENGDYLVVPDNQNDRLVFYNTSSNTLEAQIVIGNCLNLGISPDGTKVYTTSTSENLVYRIDVATQSIIGSGIEIPNGISRMTDIVSNSDGTKIYLGGNYNSTCIVDFEDNEVILFSGGTISAGVSYDHQYAIRGGSFSVIDFAAETLVGSGGDGGILLAMSPISYEGIAIAPISAPEGGHRFVFTPSNVSDAGWLIPADGIEGDAPAHVKVTADGSKVLTLNIISQNVTVFNVETNSIDTIFALPYDGDARAISATHDSQYAIVTLTDINEAKVIDLETLTIVASVPGCGGHNIRISPDNYYAYISNISGSDRINIMYLDGAASFKIGDVITGQMGIIWTHYGIYSDICMSPDGNYLAIAASWDDKLQIMDLNTNTIVQTLEGAGIDFPYQLCFNDSGTKLAVSSYQEDNVTIIDFNGSSSTIQGTYTCGGAQPHRMAYNSSTEEFYICNNESNNVVKMDANTGSLTESINLNGQPVNVAIDSDDNHIILVLNDNDGHEIFNSLGEEHEIFARPSTFDLSDSDVTAVVSPGLDYVSIITWDWTITLTAGFTSSATEICENQTVNFMDASSGDAISWEWEFEGGSPETSTLQNPTVSYLNAGTFDVTLTVSDGSNTNSLTLENYITVLDAAPGIPDIPEGPDMAYSLPDSMYNYSTNAVTSASAYIWELVPAEAGEVTENGEQCTVDFTDYWTGTAELKVKAVNDCGESDFSENLQIYVVIVGTEENYNERINIYPNPSNGKFTLNLGDKKASHIIICDIYGKEIVSLEVDQQQVFDLDLIPGVYTLHVINNNVRNSVKLMVR